MVGPERSDEFGRPEKNVVALKRVDDGVREVAGAVFLAGFNGLLPNAGRQLRLEFLPRPNHLRAGRGDPGPRERRSSTPGFGYKVCALAPTGFWARTVLLAVDDG